MRVCACGVCLALDKQKERTNEWKRKKKTDQLSLREKKKLLLGLVLPLHIEKVSSFKVIEKLTCRPKFFSHFYRKWLEVRSTGIRQWEFKLFDCDGLEMFA